MESPLAVKRGEPVNVQVMVYGLAGAGNGVPPTGVNRMKPSFPPKQLTSRMLESLVTNTLGAVNVTVTNVKHKLSSVIVTTYNLSASSPVAVSVV